MTDTSPDGVVIAGKRCVSTTIRSQLDITQSNAVLQRVVGWPLFLISKPLKRMDWGRSAATALLMLKSARTTILFVVSCWMKVNRTENRSVDDLGDAYRAMKVVFNIDTQHNSSLPLLKPKTFFPDPLTKGFNLTWMYSQTPLALRVIWLSTLSQRR